MADELQSLLEKINAEGVKKAEAEREKIVSAAKSEAERIVSAAKAEAESIVSAAKTEGDALRTRVENEVRQAARDIVRNLEAELKERLNAAVSGAAAQALDPGLMAEVVKMLAARFVADPDGEVTVRCAVKDRDALDAALKNALADSLAQSRKVLADRAMTGGLEFSADNGRLYFDFSLEAVREVLGVYAGEQVAALFDGK